MQLPTAQQTRQLPWAVNLGQGRNICVEIGILADQAKEAMMVGLALVVTVTCPMGGDHGYPEGKRQPEPLRVGQLVSRLGE